MDDNPGEFRKPPMQVAFQVSADFVGLPDREVPVQVQMKSERNTLRRLAGYELVSVHACAGNLTEIGNGTMK